MRKVDLSLILPAYNEGPTFEKSVSKILKHLSQLNVSWEVIFVEDKSTDNTKMSVKSLVEKNKNVRAIYHSRNLGRGKSVSDGIRTSRAPICGYMDVDCEVSPSYIDLFYKEIKKGSDMAVGKRFYERSWSSIQRVIASKIYALIVKSVLHLPIEDTETGYKFFNKSSIVRILPKIKDHYWFWDTEICARCHLAGLNVTEIPVLFIRRPEKKSTVKIFSDSVIYLKRLISFRSEMKSLVTS